MKTVGRRRTTVTSGHSESHCDYDAAAAPIMLLRAGCCHTPARQTIAATMLKPTFDLLKQPIRHDIPAAVYATVTKQYASGKQLWRPRSGRVCERTAAYGMVFLGGT